RLRPVLPEPAHHIGKDFRGVLAVVAALAPYVVHVVAGEDERPLQFLIRHPPIAGVDILVRAAILEKNSDRLRLVLADERWIVVPAAQTDIGADCAEHAAKRIRPLPSRGE